MSDTSRPHADSPPEPPHGERAREDDVEHGLGSGTPDALRQAAREARREEAQRASQSTPEHWRDGDEDD